MRDLSKAKQVIEETENLIGFRYFKGGCCCAIGALTLETKKHNLINILKDNNFDRFEPNVFSDAKIVSKELEKEYSLTLLELQNIQDINDNEVMTSEKRKSLILKYLDELESK